MKQAICASLVLSALVLAGCNHGSWQRYSDVVPVAYSEQLWMTRQLDTVRDGKVVETRRELFLCEKQADGQPACRPASIPQEYQGSDFSARVEYRHVVIENRHGHNLPPSSTVGDSSPARSSPAVPGTVETRKPVATAASPVATLPAASDDDRTCNFANKDPKRIASYLQPWVGSKVEIVFRNGRSISRELLGTDVATIVPGPTLIVDGEGGREYHKFNEIHGVIRH